MTMSQTATARLAQLQAMLAAEPEDLFLLYALGMEHMRLKDMAAALAQFALIMQRDPKYVAAYFMSGQALVQQGDSAAARDMLTRGIAVAQSVGDEHAAGEMRGLLAEL